MEQEHRQDFVFLDLEVLSDLLVIHGCSNKTGKVRGTTLKTGDYYPLSRFIEEFGRRHIIWNKRYDAAILRQLFAENDGKVDTDALRKFSDKLILDSKPGSTKKAPKAWVEGIAFGEMLNFIPQEYSAIGSARSGHSGLVTAALKKTQAYLKYGDDPSTSLVTFDFNKYTNIADIERDGLYDKFYEYAEHDVVSMYHIWRALKCDEDFELKWRAYESSSDDVPIEMVIQHSPARLVKHCFYSGAPQKTDIKLDFPATGYPEADSALRDPSLTKRLIRVCGCTGNIGWGGLHLAKPSEKPYVPAEGEVLLNSDVASMYPSILRQNTEHLPQLNMQKFCSMIDERLEAKASGDKKTANMLKLVINSTFGALGMKYDMKDGGIASQAALALVTQTGQWSLLTLIRMLETGLDNFSLFVANTDGIHWLINRSEYDKAMSICSEWERLTGLVLEHDELSKLTVRNVNSVLQIGVDGKSKGTKEFNPRSMSGRVGSLSQLPLNVFRPDVPLVPYVVTAKNLVGIEPWTPIYLTSPEKGKPVLWMNKHGEEKHKIVDRQELYYTLDSELADPGYYRVFPSDIGEMQALEDDDPLIEERESAWEDLSLVYSEDSLVPSRTNKRSFSRDVLAAFTNKRDLLRTYQATHVKLIPGGGFIVFDIDQNTKRESYFLIEAVREFGGNFVQSTAKAKKYRGKAVIRNDLDVTITITAPENTSSRRVNGKDVTAEVIEVKQGAADAIVYGDGYDNNMLPCKTISQFMKEYPPELYGYSVTSGVKVRKNGVRGSVSFDAESIAALAELGYYRSRSHINGVDGPCPDCQAQSLDSSGDNLGVFIKEDGSLRAYCIAENKSKAIPKAVLRAVSSHNKTGALCPS